MLSNEAVMIDRAYLLGTQEGLKQKVAGEQYFEERIRVSKAGPININE